MSNVISVVVVVSAVEFLNVIADFMRDDEENEYNYHNGFINKNMHDDWREIINYCQDCGSDICRAINGCRIAYKFYHKFGDFPKEETLKRLFF